MVRTMRRKEKMTSNVQTISMLERGSYGILSTIGEDGYPYGVPVNYVYVDGKIYIHCAKGVGHKLENIKFSPKVCFTVVADLEILAEKFDTKYESVVVYGTAKEILEKKKESLVKLIEKYSAEYVEEGLKYVSKAIDKVSVIEITVEHMTGKTERG